jgi:hypothetical protein
MSGTAATFQGFRKEFLASFESPGLAFLFNGEPQAQASVGNDGCGLPLND